MFQVQKVVREARIWAKSDAFCLPESLKFGPRPQKERVKRVGTPEKPFAPLKTSSSSGKSTKTSSKPGEEARKTPHGRENNLLPTRSAPSGLPTFKSHKEARPWMSARRSEPRVTGLGRELRKHLAAI